MGVVLTLSTLWAELTNRRHLIEWDGMGWGGVGFCFEFRINFLFYCRFMAFLMKTPSFDLLLDDGNKIEKEWTRTVGLCPPNF